MALDDAGSRLRELGWHQGALIPVSVGTELATLVAWTHLLGDSDKLFSPASDLNLSNSRGLIPLRARVDSNH